MSFVIPLVHAEGYLHARPWSRTAAFVLDPDGDNIEAVFHGEAGRSAASVRIKAMTKAAADSEKMWRC